MRFARAALVLVALALAGCRGDPAGQATPREMDVELISAVQKGAFVAGSDVQVALLDSKLNPKGAVLDTKTVNDKGELELRFTASGPVVKALHAGSSGT